MNRTLTMVALCCLAAGAPTSAHAQAPRDADADVDVTVDDAPAPSRVLAIEWNPLPLLLGRVSGNLVIVPVDHHALVISPFWLSVHTAPVTLQDANGNCLSVLTERRYSGYGAELGYRYYFSTGGPRGFFVGPSLLLASVTADDGSGHPARALSWGLAADGGFQLLVADRVSLSLGLGLQYWVTGRHDPSPQFPSRLLVERGLLPRALLSAGWAL